MAQDVDIIGASVVVMELSLNVWTESVMGLPGRLTDGEPQVRYGFSLCRVLHPGLFEQSYDLLGVVEVPANPRVPEKLSPGLRPWALATLEAGGYSFGRYYASYSTLDEEGEPDKAVAQEYIDWSGATELVPVDQSVEAAPAVLR